jgi:hypothetical protein
VAWQGHGLASDEEWGFTVGHDVRDEGVVVVLDVAWVVGRTDVGDRPDAARYRHLTGREHNRLTPTQAQTAVARAILRQLYAVVVHQQAWDPVIAAHGTTIVVKGAAA